MFVFLILILPSAWTNDAGYMLLSPNALGYSTKIRQNKTQVTAKRRIKEKCANINYVMRYDIIYASLPLAHKNDMHAYRI